MKKTAAILLLIILSICMSGSFIAFSLRKAALRSEIRAYLRSHPEAGGEILAFDLKNGEVFHEDFSWEEEHEFMFEGEMYDVISSEMQGNKISFRCMKDKAENELIERFQSSVKKNNTGNDKNNFKLFAPVFPEQDFETVIRNNFCTQAAFHTPTVAASVAKGHSRSDDHPPQA